jgi:hypothetical protein
VLKSSPEIAGKASDFMGIYFLAINISASAQVFMEYRRS